MCPYWNFTILYVLDSRYAEIFETVFFYFVLQAVFPKLALKYGIIYPEIQLSNVHDVSSLTYMT